jgi:hypothetical protein
MQWTNASNTAVNLQITAGAVTYGSPVSMTFANTVSASFSVQTLSQDFTGVANYFWVQDMKGSDSGYNTTLQLSGNLTAWANVISGSNISFKAIGSIILVTWSANTWVQFDPGTSAYQALNTSRTFIFRPAGVNNTKIGYYAGNINLQANIPASQAAGSYTATMVFTLIEN